MSRRGPPGAPHDTVAELLRDDARFHDPVDRLGPELERRLDPARRRALGQVFTPTPLVDLLCSLAIRDAEAAVLDPACGSGAMLVRALDRARWLRGHDAPEATPALYGYETDPTAAALADANLTRRAGRAAPGAIDRADFLATDPGPEPRVDAVIGNPPYLQQEDQRDKRARVAALRRWTGIQLSTRADLHCAFWPLSIARLRPGGRLAFVSSAQWLDAAYGEGLRRWLRTHARVVAVIDSEVEAWFPRARVDAVVTVLERPDPRDAASDAPVRLIRLREPLGRLLGVDGDELARAPDWATTDALVDVLLAGPDGGRDARARIRAVDQGALGDPSAPRPPAVRPARPVRWGALLRTPPVWERLIARTGERWRPLGQLATVRRGITSGCDRLFYLRDESARWLERIPDAAAFARRIGAPRVAVADGALRVVDDPLHPGHPRALEAAALRPLLRSPQELGSRVVTGADCTHRVLRLSHEDALSASPRILRLLRDAEARALHRRRTCAARAASGRAWFDVGGPAPAPLLWPKERQYRHVAPLNPDGVLANGRFYTVVPSDPASASVATWAGLLNSSWIALSALLAGRPVGAEGVWSTMVGETRAMWVPDPGRAPPGERARVADALEALRDRPLLPLVAARAGDPCELDRADLRALDDAVLRLLGLERGQERGRLIDELYDQLRADLGRRRGREVRAVEARQRVGYRRA